MFKALYFLVLFSIFEREGRIPGELDASAKQDTRGGGGLGSEKKIFLSLANLALRPSHSPCTRARFARCFPLRGCEQSNRMRIPYSDRLECM